MPRELISKKTRNEFREYFVGSSTLRQIEMEFDAADVPFDGAYEPPMAGKRRSLVEQYYHAVDFTKWSDVRKVVSVYEIVLSTLEQRAGHRRGLYDRHNPDQVTFDSLKKWVERDGFSYKNGQLIPIGKDLHLVEVAQAALKLDAPEIHRQIDRMKDAVEDDPALAIGTAKELVETTCKTILDERGVEFDEHSDVSELVKQTRQVLGLLNEDVPNAARGAATIRRIMSNMGAVAQGLGELRNLYGTGHGRQGHATGLGPRHARLAVGAASTLAVFLFETHEELA